MKAGIKPGSVLSWLWLFMARSLPYQSKSIHRSGQFSIKSVLSLLIQNLSNLKNLQKLMHHFQIPCLSHSSNKSLLPNHPLNQSRSQNPNPNQFQSQILILSPKPFQNLFISRSHRQDRYLNPLQNLSRSLKKSRPQILIQNRTLVSQCRIKCPLLNSPALCRKFLCPQGRCKLPLANLKAPGSNKGSFPNIQCGPGA